MHWKCNCSCTIGRRPRPLPPCAGRRWSLQRTNIAVLRHLFADKEDLNCFNSLKSHYLKPFAFEWKLASASIKNEVTSGESLGLDFTYVAQSFSLSYRTSVNLRNPWTTEQDKFHNVVLYFDLCNFANYLNFEPKLKIYSIFVHIYSFTTQIITKFWLKFHVNFINFVNWKIFLNQFLTFSDVPTVKTIFSPFQINRINCVSNLWAWK